MKQKIQIITAFLCGAIFFSGISYATNNLTASVVDLKIVVNGQEQSLSEKPVVINNRTYLPVRDIGVITGYDVSYQKGVVSLNSNNSNSENQNNSTPNQTSFEFNKLPITITNEDISVTVNSVSLGEFTTDFNVTVVNNSNNDAEINYKSFVLGANYNISGKEYKTFGTISGETEFSSPIKAGTTVTGIIRKGKVDDGTENLIFHLMINGEGYSFYIDSKDLL